MDAVMTNDPSHYAVDEHATSDERTYATLTHLTGLISVLDGLGLISFITSLILWQVKKNESPWLDDHLKEAVNFQISMLIWGVIALLVIIFTFGLGALVAAPFLLILRLTGCIRGAIFANRGRYYRYPMSFRFIG